MGLIFEGCSSVGHPSFIILFHSPPCSFGDGGLSLIPQNFHILLTCGHPDCNWSFAKVAVNHRGTGRGHRSETATANMDRASRTWSWLTRDGKLCTFNMISFIWHAECLTNTGRGSLCFTCSSLLKKGSFYGVFEFQELLSPAFSLIQSCVEIPFQSWSSRFSSPLAVGRGDVI